MAPPLPYVRTERPDGQSEYAVFDALSDIICITAFDGTLRFLNRAGRELLGFLETDDALIGCVFPAHTPAARELLLDEIIPAALRTGRTSSDTALQTADGRVFPAAQTVIVTPAGAGTPLTLTIVIRDVSIERHATRRLAESQRLFEMIARTTPDFVYLYDPAAERIVWTNRCPHAFLGGEERDARTLSRREIVRLVHHDDVSRFRDTAARMAAAYGDSDVIASEVRMRTTGGAWKWIQTRATVFSRRETGAPLLVLGTATDISVRKKLEHRLIAERAAAERANDDKNDFLARLIHDLRRTLNDVAGRAGEMRRDRERRLTQREFDHLDAVLGSTAQSLTLLSDLREYTGIESGALAVDQTPTDIAELLRESVAAFTQHPSAAHCTILVDLPDGAIPVLTDPRRLRQVVTHLIANARDFAPAGQISLALRIDPECQRPLSVDITDNGIGIASAQKPFLFTPFHASQHQSAVPEARSPGTGLGLALARATCELIGCRLDLAQSAPGTGTTFRIVLPQRSRAAELASVTYSADRSGNSAGNDISGKSVLPLV